MPTQAGAKKNSTARVTSRSRLPWEVVAVEALPDFRLHVTFADGLEGTVDMSSMIHGKDAGVFAVLADRDLFNKVYVEYDAVTWPGELDLAPDAMHAEIKKRGEWKLT